MSSISDLNNSQMIFDWILNNPPSSRARYHAIPCFSWMQRQKSAMLFFVKPTVLMGEIAIHGMISSLRRPRARFSGIPLKC